VTQVYNAATMSPVTSINPSSPRAPEDLFPYETLSYSGRLEFLDAAGAVAVFKRRQTIRVTAPRLAVFLDRIWGEGVLFADYWTGGLEIVEAVHARIGWVAILGLPRTYRRGDLLEIRTERRIVGGFTQPVEHWDSTMFAPTKWLSLEISGLAARRVKRLMLSAPQGDGVDVDRNREVLSLTVRKPDSNVPYRMEWAW
jgi:hypothetical protein